MWALIGEQDVYDDDHTCFQCFHSKEEIVALFSDAKLAAKYIQKARLKNVSRWRRLGERTFRAKSLLCNFVYARIEPYYEPDYPVDPEIK